MVPSRNKKHNLKQILFFTTIKNLGQKGLKKLVHGSETVEKHYTKLQHPPHIFWRLQYSNKINAKLYNFSASSDIVFKACRFGIVRH